MGPRIAAVVALATALGFALLAFGGLGLAQHGGGTQYCPPPGGQYDQYLPQYDQYLPQYSQYGCPPPPCPPGDQYQPPGDQYGPPQYQYGPPSDQYVICPPPLPPPCPPGDQYQPPGDQYGPPQYQYGPPSDQYVVCPPVAGAVLQLGVVSPGSVPAGANIGATATVTNIGGVPATGVEVTITLGPGLSLAVGTPTQPVGTLASGASDVRTWTLHAEDTCGSVDSFFDVFADFNELAPEATMPSVHRVVQIQGSCAISGTKWNDQNQNGTRETGEPGVPNVLICRLGSFCTLTDAGGNYSLSVPGPGTYAVYEVLPPGTVNTTPLSQTVTVTGSAVSGVDFGNAPPAPPPPEVEVEGGGGLSYNGLPIVFTGQPATYTKDVTDHCGLASPVQVKLVITSTQTGNEVSALMTNVGGEIWEAVFSSYAGFGTNSLTFYVDCPPDTPGFPEDVSLIAGEDEIQQGGSIYVDPSGTVVNACTGDPVEGAVVTLLKDIGGTFVVPPTTDHIPAVNPQTTGADGAYGWVVVPGSYRLLVQKAGFEDAESAVLTIPPAVTDLELALLPTAGCAPPPADTATLIDALIGEITAATDVKKGTRGQLVHQLNKVSREQARGNDEKACKTLGKFEKTVEKKSGKQIPDPLGDSLLAGAEDVAATLAGC